MTDSAAVASLRRLFEAVQNMDAAACAAAFSPSGVMNTPCLPSAYPRTQRGRDNIAQVFGFLFTAVFEKFAWIDLELYATEDPTLVFARGRSDTLLRNGQPYRNEYAFYARIKDGLVDEYTEFFDTERAIGAFQHLQQTA